MRYMLFKLRELLDSFRFKSPTKHYNKSYKLIELIIKEKLLNYYDHKSL